MLASRWSEQYDGELVDKQTLRDVIMPAVEHECKQLTSRAQTEVRQYTMRYFKTDKQSKRVAQHRGCG